MVAPPEKQIISPFLKIYGYWEDNRYFCIIFYQFFSINLGYHRVEETIRLKKQKLLGFPLTSALT